MQDDQRLEGEATDGLGSGDIPTPVDDATYDLLQALVSKLEAIEAYRMYAEDGSSDLFERLAREDAEHADQLLDALRDRLVAAR